jgi:hypothetical protein
VQAKGNLQTVGLSARGDRIKAGRAHGVRSPLLLAANHGARSPTISLTNSPGSARLSQWHVGFVLMHIAAMPARRGGAKLTGLIGCALPRQTTLHGCRRQRYRVLFSFSLLFKSDSGEFNELHDVFECFKYLFEFCCRCQTRPGGRGVAPSASLSHAAEASISATKVSSNQRLHASSETSILESSPRSLATSVPVPYQRFEPPSSLVDFCQNQTPLPSLGAV